MDPSTYRGKDTSLERNEPCQPDEADRSGPPRRRLRTRRIVPANEVCGGSSGGNMMSSSAARPGNIHPYSASWRSRAGTYEEDQIPVPPPPPPPRPSPYSFPPRETDTTSPPQPCIRRAPVRVVTTYYSDRYSDDNDDDDEDSPPPRRHRRHLLRPAPQVRRPRSHGDDGGAGSHVTPVVASPAVPTVPLSCSAAAPLPVWTVALFVLLVLGLLVSSVGWIMCSRHKPKNHSSYPRGPSSHCHHCPPVSVEYDLDCHNIQSRKKSRP